MSNECPYCHFNRIIKYCKRGDKQRYQCTSCKRTWTEKSPSQNKAKQVMNDSIILDYINGTVVMDLVERYGKSERTIRRLLEDLPDVKVKILGNSDVIGMDVTYFGKSWGILLVMDLIRKIPVYCTDIIGSESVEDYEEAIRALAHAGPLPKACVVDGRSGVAEMLERYHIAVQMCQFHQVSIVKRYLASDPKLEPNRQLKELMIDLKYLNEEQFLRRFFLWRSEWLTWVNESYTNESGKKELVHQKTHSAMNSILRHYDHLFTFEHYPELEIPRTNNILEGNFSILKSKLLQHKGCNKTTKIKIINLLLSIKQGELPTGFGK